MHPLLEAAADEARTLGAPRGWAAPSEAALAGADALLPLLLERWRPPQVQVEPEGAVVLEWDSAQGWLQLRLAGDGQIAHSAVIGGDDYQQAEAWAPGQPLPGWVAALLPRLFAGEH